MPMYEPCMHTKARCLVNPPKGGAKDLAIAGTAPHCLSFAAVLYRIELISACAIEA